MGKTFRKHLINTIEENTELLKEEKIKKVDKKHGVVITTDGAFKEDIEINDEDKIFDADGKRILKKVKRKKERNEKISEEIE